MSNFKIMKRLIGLLTPLLYLMCLTILMGIAGYFCAIFITILGGYGMLSISGIPIPFSFKTLCILIIVLGLMRGVLHYLEQASGHTIAFKLLAIIRDHVFKALRRLAPAKLEGRDKGNLIAVITSDIELLEVFYAHTIAPVSIAIVVSLFMVFFIGQYHFILGIIACISYLLVGCVVPIAASKIGASSGRTYRSAFGHLNTYFLDSLRGLKECIQYQCGDKRLNEILKQSDGLDQMQKKLKYQEGITAAVTNTCILGASILLFFTAAALMNKGILGFEGVLIPTIALFSSFGPTAALSSLSNNLLQTFASGERVLAILDEPPVTEEKQMA